MVGEAVDGRAVGGEPRAGLGFRVPGEEPRPVPPKKILCMGGCDPPPADADIDQSHAAETRPEESDGTEGETHGSGPGEEVAEGLPGFSDGERLPRTGGESQGQQQAEAREEMGCDCHGQDDSESDADGGLQGIMGQHTQGQRERSAGSPFFPGPGRAHGHRDETQIQQMIGQVVQPHGLHVHQDPQQIVDEHENETGGQRIGNEETLEETETVPHIGGNQQSGAEEPQVDEYFPRLIHTDPPQY